jgi:hypothetical protein
MTTRKNDWDHLVGSQSCLDFMYYSADHAEPFSMPEIEYAVDTYLAELPSMFREVFTNENWTNDDIAEARQNLISEIEKYFTIFV